MKHVDAHASLLIQRSDAQTLNLPLLAADITLPSLQATVSGTQPPQDAKTVMFPSTATSTTLAMSTPSPIMTSSITNAISPPPGAAQPTDSASGDADTPQGLPKDAMIGIIIGIIVVVLLALLGCSMCFLDFRRRHRNRKERKKNRQSELTMLETEMRNGQTVQQRRTRNGLWDHLKIRSASVDENAESLRDAQDTQSVVEIGRDLESQHEVGGARKDSAATQLPGGSETGLFSVYFQRDRSSIVSSDPSVSSAAGKPPVMPRSFVDGGVRR